MSQPLSGIRILDLSRLLPGAYASQMLADFGAEVIKVEEPGSGDYGRYMQPHGPGGLSLYFLAINRNKRSVTLNLKTPQGREIFLRMVREADVILESFRPGVMERLGLGYEQLREIKPGIIYCAISGYGQTGPYRLRAGHDLNYEGYAGLLDYNRSPDGALAMPPTQLADLAGGSFMAIIGILTALLGRTRTGEGRMVDVAMSEGILSLMPLVATAYLNTGKVPQPGHSTLDGALPCYNMYETQDGKYVTLAALEPKFWHTFCTHIGHLELLPFHLPLGPEERAQAMEIVANVFKTKTRAEWLAEFADIDACVGPVYTLDEALRDPQVQARGVSVTDGTGETTFYTLTSFPRISDVDMEQLHSVPTLGEHNAELLHSLGYNEAQIARLKSDGII